MFSNVGDICSVGMYVWGPTGEASGLFHAILCGQKAPKNMVVLLVGKVSQSSNSSFMSM